ncbi:MAG: family efflux transporter permease subunit [Actinomycetia bacterium]|nr:family efflux transporter permease subunit [Actinomycetes bacterium]
MLVSNADVGVAAAVAAGRPPGLDREPAGGSVAPSALPLGESAARVRARWVAFGAVVAGTFVVSLDRTMVTVALPSIGHEFGSTGLDAVVTANLIAIAVASPGAGWLAQRFGTRRVLLVSLSAFVASALVASTATSLGMLIAARVAEGASGGVMMAVTLAAIYGLFDAHDRPRAFAVQAAVVMVSPALGPILGGYMSETEWRITFLFAALLGAGSMAVAWAKFRPVEALGSDGAFDWQGWLLAGIGLPLVLLASTRANDWHWFSVPTLGILGLAFVALGAFVYRELHLGHPLIELRMLRDRMFRYTFILEWLITMPYQAQLVLMPLELTTISGVSPLRAGLMITPSALGTIAALRPASRLFARSGVRAPVLIGSVLLAGATAALSCIGPHTSLAFVSAVMVVHGAGGGLCLMPLLVAGLESVEPRLVAQASAIRLVNKLVAQAVSVSLSVALVTALVGKEGLLSVATADRLHVAAAYGTVDRILVIPAVLAFALALYLGRTRVSAARPDLVDEPDVLIAISDL